MSATAYFTIPGWSQQLWRLDPPRQPGDVVRIECDAIRDDDGRPANLQLDRRLLAAANPPAAAPMLPAVPVAPTARATDPVTSHEAAQALTAERVNADHLLVLSTLAAHGPQTDHRMASLASAEAGFQRIQTSLGVRRGELRDAGLVVDSGHKEKTPTGKKAIRWAITASGLELLAVKR